LHDFGLLIHACFKLVHEFVGLVDQRHLEKGQHAIAQGEGVDHSDVRIDNARFAQLEIRRGIYPFGGATIRLPQQAGWGNAMRWLLTGDEFDAAEAHRIGLVAEVVDGADAAKARAREIAHVIADRAAPLGVKATLASAHLARTQGDTAAIDRLRPEVVRLFGTADAAEGVQSFIERRAARFVGD